MKVLITGFSQAFSAFPGAHPGIPLGTPRNLSKSYQAEYKGVHIFYVRSVSLVSVVKRLLHTKKPNRLALRENVDGCLNRYKIAFYCLGMLFTNTVK